MFLEEQQKNATEQKVTMEKFKAVNSKSIEEEKADLMQKSIIIKKEKSAEKSEGIEMLLDEEQDVP